MGGRHRRGRHRKPSPGPRHVLRGAALAAAVLVMVAALRAPDRPPAAAVPVPSFPDPPRTYVTEVWAAPRITTERPPPPPPTTTVAAATSEEVVTAEKATSPSAAEPPPPPPKPAPKPKPKPPPPPPPASCPTELKGTRPHVAQVGHHVAQKFGVPLSAIGGYRASARDKAGHPAGRALDWMVGRGTGDAIAEYLLANQGRFAVRYVIWRQRYNNGSGWDPMSDRGGATANHMDHVHASFEANGPVDVTC